MFKDGILYWIWLADACGTASKSFVRLIERFESPFEIYSLDPSEIEQIDFISHSLKERLSDKSLEKSYSVMKNCKSDKIEIISYADKRYPSRLRLLPDAPAILFCKGKLPDFNSRLCVAIVGTRKMSEYGKRSAYQIGYELAAANAVVVSGMALGIDSVAACGAIGAGGNTVAVLGSGIDVIYPKEHGTLYDKIVKCGAVISEFMPSTPPDRYNFPKRNRIISGLCQGTLIVEGDARSGALITAKTALAQGREVFALPGKINESNSEGPNELIRSGVHVALCSDDIIGHYDFLYHDAIDYKGLKKAKRSSEFDASLIEKLGISARAYKDFSGYTGAAEALTEQRSENIQAAQKKLESKLDSRPDSKSQDIQKESEKVDASRSVSSDHEALLATLDAAAQRVFRDMPIDSAVLPDKLVCGGLSIGDVVTALTMLELCGLVSSLPGGLYIRK